MSVKLNDDWISHLWPSIADDCLRFQKITPTGTSGNKYRAEALFLGDVITKPFIQDGMACNPAWTHPGPTKKNSALFRDLALGQVVNFVTEYFLAGETGGIQSVDDDATSIASAQTVRDARVSAARVWAVPDSVPVNLTVLIAVAELSV